MSFTSGQENTEQSALNGERGKGQAWGTGRTGAGEGQRKEPPSELPRACGLLLPFQFRVSLRQTFFPSEWPEAEPP